MSKGCVAKFDEERGVLHAKVEVRKSELRVNPLGAGFDGELEGRCVAVAFDGEFDTAALTGGGGPGGLPELVGGAIASDDGCF